MVNVQIAMAQIEDYLGQERYAALLRETALVFVPMCNPDGVRIAQEGADWIEDEAARADVQRWIDESGEPYDQWKANGRGVDLNRNFDARWDEQTEERATGRPGLCVLSRGKPRKRAGNTDAGGIDERFRAGFDH